MALADVVAFAVALQRMGFRPTIDVGVDFKWAPSGAEYARATPSIARSSFRGRGDLVETVT